MNTYDLKNRFFYMDGPDQYLEPARYGDWTRSYCGKCANQKDGLNYGCPLLKALDKAIIADRGIVPISIARQVWENLESRFEGSDKCQQFVSKRAKTKPTEEKAP